MQSLFGSLTVLGLISACTPWTIVAVIVLLSSRRGLPAAAAFGIGWFCSSAVVAGVTVVAASRLSSSTSEGSSRAGLELAIGLLALAGAARFSRRARGRTGPAPEPSWLGKLDAIGVIAAFAFGAFWINMPLVIDAGLAIAAADTSTGEAAAGVLYYALLASLGPIIILSVYVADRSRADARLRQTRTWVGGHVDEVMAGLLALVGAALIVKALIALL